MTGITWLAFELVGKRLELLKEAVPRISLVAAIGSPRIQANNANCWRRKALPEPGESHLVIGR